jgi:integrase/recombinase XerC
MFLSMAGASNARTRDVSALVVPAVGAVVAVDRTPWFVLTDADGCEVESVTDYLRQLDANDCSRHTIRAYALSMLRFMRFLWAVDVTWQRASAVEARDFVLWARQAEKFAGNKTAPKGTRQARNPVSGKRTPTTRYSPGTINHSITVCREFFDHQLAGGSGPLVNPFRRTTAPRRHAHHDPEDPFTYAGRDPLRQKAPARLPRAIPDAQFDGVFRRLGSSRDRALVAFYVSSGVRASELLELTGDRINVGDQLIGVVRKGGALQWVPAAPDAFIWLRLYQLERGVAGPGERVWLTQRGEPRPLGYDAFRAVLRRVNEVLGSDWTMHDFRHTFAIRALEGGLQVHELQELLGHASLEATSIYLRPRAEDIVQHYRAALDKRSGKPADTEDQPPLATTYDRAELDFLMGGST